MTWNNAEYLKIRYRKREQEGKCGTCGNSKILGQACQKCAAKAKSNRARRIRNGTCYSCSNEKRINNARCLPCILKNISTANLGTNKHADFLLDLFIKQNKQCRYCSVALIITYNAQVDHIWPRERFPEKSRDRNNVQWLCTDCNRSKNAKTEQELRQFAETILKVIPNE